MSWNCDNGDTVRQGRPCWLRGKERMVMKEQDEVESRKVYRAEIMGATSVLVVGIQKG